MFVIDKIKNMAYIYIYPRVKEFFGSFFSLK